jgi:hypothetical protein
VGAAGRAAAVGRARGMDMDMARVRGRRSTVSAHRSTASGRARAVAKAGAAPRQPRRRGVTVAGGMAISAKPRRRPAAAEGAGASHSAGWSPPASFRHLGRRNALSSNTGQEAVCMSSACSDLSGGAGRQVTPRPAGARSKGSRPIPADGRGQAGRRAVLPSSKGLEEGVEGTAFSPLPSALRVSMPISNPEASL